MISRLRKRTDSLAFVLAKPFVVLNVHPNVVSLLAIPIALVFAFLIFRGLFLPAFFFGVLAFLVDLFDGSVARQLGRCTLFGNYLEGIIDKAVDFIVIGSFVFLFPLATAIALGSSFLVSFAKPRVGLVIMTDNRHWPGIGERGDKVAILLLGLLLSAFFPSFFGLMTMEIVLYLVSGIALVGLLQRVLYAWKLIEEAKKKGLVLPYLREDRSARSAK